MENAAAGRPPAIMSSGHEGCCLDPATRILTADLRWVTIADARIGQELVACDEHRPPGRRQGIGGRRMRTAVVEKVRHTRRPAYRIRFDNGQSIICSAEHRWLRRGSRNVAWGSIGGSGDPDNRRDALRLGDALRAIALPWSAPDPRDLWFGGVIDGEGSFDFGRHGGAQLGVTQCDGPVLERMLGHCLVRRYGHCVTTEGAPSRGRIGRRPVHTIYICGMSALFRVLGLSRPVRFIGARWWEGKRMPDNGWRAITAIEPLGERDLVDIQTSTGTYIAEAFVSHDAAFVSAPSGACPD